MVTITLHCPRYQSEALVRNGHAPNGKQLYRCRECGRQAARTQLPTPLHQLAAKRSCTPMKNAAVCAASKSVVMHEACLLLFLHHYKRERAILLK